jgi:hypothetical protein
MSLKSLYCQTDRQSAEGSTHSMDRWINGGSLGKPRYMAQSITLNEFSKGGTCADGSPQMSKKSFYDWKKKVHKELREQEAKKKNVSL